jgi:DinB family protein
MNETPQQYGQRVAGYLEGKDPVEVLCTTPRELQKLIKGASVKSLDAKPAPDKWSATMILAHLADTEIVYAFRLRLMLAASGITIQGIDQEAWAVTFDYGTQDPAASVEDFRVNRERTLRMLKKLSKQQWDCYGMHSERGKETVRRVVELLAGHDINHLRQIHAIFGR